MTYLWSIPDDYPEKLIGFYDINRSPDRFLFRKGCFINEKLDKIFVTVGANKAAVRKYNDFQNSSGLPLVDSKVRVLLDEIAEFEVQYFDAVIECKDGVIEDYKIVNVTHAVPAIDHNSSQYDLIEGSDAVLGFKHLVLKPNCLGTHAIARNQEYQPHILLSQQLFDAFKKHKITGVELITTEEFNSIGPI